MAKMKKAYVFLIVIMIFSICSGCTLPPILDYNIIYKKPCGQPNTRWESEDGRISFAVDEEGRVTGCMLIDGEEIDISISYQPESGVAMIIYPISVRELDAVPVDAEYEYWLCSFPTKKKFVATVKETTYFEAGEEITFHRIDDETIK